MSVEKGYTCIASVDLFCIEFQERWHLFNTPRFYTEHANLLEYHVIEIIP